MSDDRKPAGLDARIDATLRALVGSQEPVGLRERVMARVRAGEEPPRRGPAATWTLALGAAVLVAVAIAALLLRPERAPETSARKVAEERRSPTPTPTAQAPGPIPTAPTPRVAAEASPAMAERPRTRRAASPRRGDPPGWRSSALEELTLERIEVPAIAWEEQAGPAEIAVSDIHIPPVDLEPSPSSLDQ